MRVGKVPVVEKILIFIKHHLSFLWKAIEWGNGFIFCLFYKAKIEEVLPLVFQSFAKAPYTYRKLRLSDAGLLSEMIARQDASDLEYFRPHRFNLASVRKQFNKCSFLMMGVFEEEKIIGYFFLRFFANRKCFVGRLIDKNYRGMGIGNVMNKIMYETAWRMGFRCLSTISRHNKAIMKAHSKNQKMRVIKELQHDYLLVEFIR